MKLKSHNKPKPIHLDKNYEIINNLPIKKKFKIPTPNTKEKYNVKTQIKTFNNKKLLNNFNNLTKNEIFHFLSKNNVKITRKAPIELYKTLSMILSINKNHKLKFALITLTLPFFIFLRILISFSRSSRSSSSFESF